VRKSFCDLQAIGIAEMLYYSWKNEAEQGTDAALWTKTATVVENEKIRRSRRLDRTSGLQQVLENLARTTRLELATSAVTA